MIKGGVVNRGEILVAKNIKIQRVNLGKTRAVKGIEIRVVKVGKIQVVKISFFNKEFL